jgi:TonB family protein
MSLRPALLVLIALMAPALADTPVVPQQSTVPKAVGAPHMCPTGQYYPKDAMARNAQGTVRLTFDVGVDGTVQNLKIGQSSGDASLDQAAITCASSWRYTPAMQNDKPIQKPWSASVIWALRGGDTPAMIDPVLKEPRHPVCAEAHGDPGRTTPPMPANVVLQVSADGDVTSTGVWGSSGDKTFDAYAMSCAKQWKFRPATENGVPVKTLTHFWITWLGAPIPPNTEPSLAGDADVCTGRMRPDGAVKPLVQFLVETDGTAKYTKIETSSGDADYDAYAVSCVSHWTFHPATHYGHPSETGWHVTVD